MIKELKENKMVGVGQWQGGVWSRALGNRSLLADPRGEDIKDLVNQSRKDRSSDRSLRPY